MEEKLDRILKGIENLTTRIDKLDSKFELFETRLFSLEKTLDDQIDKLDKKLETKVDCTVFENFNLRLLNIEQQQISGGYWVRRMRQSPQAPP